MKQYSLLNSYGQDYIDSYYILFGREPKYFPTEPVNDYTSRKWCRNNKIEISLKPVIETGIRHHFI